MQDYEVNTILDNLPYLDRNGWEQSRFQIYSTIQVNSKKKINPTDVMKFAWDNESETTSINNEEIERLKEKSKYISLNLNNGE